MGGQSKSSKQGARVNALRGSGGGINPSQFMGQRQTGQARQGTPPGFSPRPAPAYTPPGEGPGLGGGMGTGMQGGQGTGMQGGGMMQPAVMPGGGQQWQSGQVDDLRGQLESAWGAQQGMQGQPQVPPQGAQPVPGGFNPAEANARAAQAQQEAQAQQLAMQQRRLQGGFGG